VIKHVGPLGSASRFERRCSPTSLGCERWTGTIFWGDGLATLLFSFIGKWVQQLGDFANKHVDFPFPFKHRLVVSMMITSKNGDLANKSGDLANS